MRRLHGAPRRRADPVLLIAGIGGRGDKGHHPRRARHAGEAAPVQTAFIAEQVPQCGYCLNGWIMTAAALLREVPHPSEQQIRDGLSGLKCRCGTHMAILRAVRRAAQAA
jgi:aerobic-type carbon monoxide dehydrogenase small subunit (CoxS/CutS family)